jgi:putrescine transport system permease protein
MLFSGMVYAPLVMPEVITGLSLLLLFVAIGFDRGFWTITLAHTTLTMCFVAVVVQSRLLSFDRRSRRPRWISVRRPCVPSSR